MNGLAMKNLGQFKKILGYDEGSYTVIMKEKLHNKQIDYEATNNKTGLRVTYTSKSLFFSHFRAETGAVPCQK